MSAHGLIFFALAAASSPALAECNLISKLPWVIDQPGKYCLSHDLAVSPDALYELSGAPAALTIDSAISADQSVTIDLNGHTLSLQAESSEYTSATRGVDISGGGNVNILNGTIQGFDLAIYGASDGGGSLTIDRIDIVMDHPDLAYPSGYATGIYVLDFDRIDVLGGSIINETNLNGFGFRTSHVRAVKVTGVDIISTHGIVIGGGTESANVHHAFVESYNPTGATSYGIMLGAEKSIIADTAISGFPIGLNFSTSAGAYSRMTVLASSDCFIGGTSVGLSNTCTIEP